MSKKTMNRSKPKMASVNRLVPTVGTCPSDPPAISLNPKRNYTVVFYGTAATSGSITAPTVAMKLIDQLSNQVSQPFPTAPTEWIPTFFKNMVVRKVDLWGVADSISYAPFSLTVDALPHVPRPPVQSDMSGGSNSRARASVNFPQTSWYTVESGTQSKLVSYKGAVRMHVHVTVW